MKSLKIKFIILIAGCLICSVAIIGSIGILNTKKVIGQDSVQIMNLLCSERAKKIDSILLRIEQSVETLALYTKKQIKDRERFQKEQSYVKQCSDKIEEVAVSMAENTEGALTVYVRFNKEFAGPASGIFYTRESEKGLFEKQQPTNLSYYDKADIERVGWYYIPAGNKKATWMKPYYNRNINEWMISYVIPIFIDGDEIGVVGMDIDFHVLEDLVKGTSVYKTGYAFLTDEEAKIICHKKLEYNSSLAHQENSELRRMAEILKNDEMYRDLYSYVYEKTEKMMTFQTLENGMKFVLTAPIKEIDKQENALIFQILIFSVFIEMCAVIMTVLVTRRITKPLHELDEAAKRIAEGDLSISITYHSEDEIGALAESFRQTVLHLCQYTDYINGLVYRDNLTGVKNKMAYREKVSQLEEKIKRKSKKFIISILDINNLKKINDEYGYEQGDMAIVNSCRIICKVFHNYTIYRIQGGKFVALLEDTEDEKLNIKLIYLRSMQIEYNQDPENTIKIFIAAGMSIYDKEKDIVYNDVYKRAEEAVIKDKREMKD